MDINKLTEFVGKRNCALTFLIPPNTDFKKSIKQIDKKINGLKHENKKKQLRLVINKIKENVKDINQFENNGMIICCGLNNNNMIEYYQKKPIKRIDQIEYFYDYRFHINRIFQNLFNSVEYLNKDDQQEYIDNLERLRNEGMIVYQKELDQYMELRLLKTVLYFTNDEIELLLINKSKEYNFNIKLFNDKSKFTELQENYGKCIGILHYKVDWVNR